MSHQAIVARVTRVTPILKAEKIHLAEVLGESVIVSKDVDVGCIGVLFPEGLQLSEEYCKENNLHRHADLNKDNTKTGFFDDNRKVRAQPFLGVKSSAYFAPLQSLDYIIVDAPPKLGEQFSVWYGKEICQKYISQATKDAINKQNRPKMAKKDFAPFFAKHTDSAQLKHGISLIPVGSLISFHSKKHGTSHRQSYTKITKELSRWKQFVNKIIPGVYPEWEWGHVVGSRNVVFTPNKELVGHHGSDYFRFDVAKQIEPYLTKGMSAYAEIVGFVNGKSIMPSHDIKALKDKAYLKKYGDKVTYTYGCKPHEYKFHIYRLTYLTEDGVNVDFTQKQLEQWCDDRNLPRTLDVAPAIVYDGDSDKLLQMVKKIVERDDVLTEDYTDPTHISEGIILRIDTGKMQPTFMKQKSYCFSVCEGISEAVDTEDAA